MTEHTDPAAERAPVLSVVVPVYNTEKYLPECLDSLLAHPPKGGFEILCVDDGSTDRSVEILRDYEARYPCIRVFTQSHQYAGAARNTGIRAARGKYIHFLDSDDLMDSGGYPWWLRCAEAAHADVCECLYTNVNADTKAVVNEPWYAPWDETKPLSLSDDGNAVSLIKGRVIPWNKLYLRTFLLENGILFDDLICAEDRSFYYEVIRKARTYVRIYDRYVTHRLSIGTSLDGSDIRLRHFEVEFRSFERIWEIMKDAPEKAKRMTLDNCIGDSCLYYLRALGTSYETPLRHSLCAYWRPWLPLLGTPFPRDTRWYLTFRTIEAAERHERYGRLLMYLLRRYHALNRPGAITALRRKTAKALLLLALAFVPLKTEPASARP